MGLALFTLVGVNAALDSGLHPISAVVAGCVTGAAGGMFRDVLCGLQPSILSRDLYATISIIGGTDFTFSQNHIELNLGFVTAFILMIVLRSYVISRSV